MYIYEIINVKNNKKYIGQTIQPIKNRWSVHFRMLNNKKHYNKNLQKDWNKYGKLAFTFIKVYQGKSKKELNFFEKERIQETNQNELYNIRSGGVGSSRSILIKNARSIKMRPTGYPPVLSPTGKIFFFVNLQNFCKGWTLLMENK